MLNQSDPILLPRLTLRVGVTGHRPNKLNLEQQRRVRGSTESILKCLSQAARHVRKTHSDVLAESDTDLRLVTSLAEGADTIIAKAAREAGYRLDVILPFPKQAFASDQCFSAEARSTFHDFLADPSLHSLLELDGDPDDGYSASLGYLAAGRRVVAHSDILLAVWNGEREDGIGGTAQIVREALDHGVPVIWMRPDGDARLVVDRSSRSDFDKHTAILTQDDGCSQDLSNLVRDQLSPPKAEEEAGFRLRRFMREPHRTGSTWSQYDLMRKILTGRKYKLRLDYSVDSPVKEASDRYEERERLIGGDRFAGSMKDKLESRRRRADNVALHCSHAYRSTYILNFFLAAFAVLVGLLSVFWWTLDNGAVQNSVVVKAAFVSIEVVLILIILISTRLGRSSNRDWHVRWLEARSIAELLHSAQFLSLIGSTAAPRGQIDGHEEKAWVEWYVRATLREVGPPTGHLTSGAIKSVIKSVIEDEISGQIKYNEDAKESYREIDHKLHLWGERLFKATLFVGILYVCIAMLYLTGKLLHWDHSLESVKYFKNPIKAVVTVLGAGLPAFGAALFGIRATGDFRVASEQAERTLVELKDLSMRLEKEAAEENPSRERVSRLIYELTQVLVSNLRDWTKIYRSRELQLPA